MCCCSSAGVILEPATFAIIPSMTFRGILLGLPHLGRQRHGRDGTVRGGAFRRPCTSEGRLSAPSRPLRLAKIQYWHPPSGASTTSFRVTRSPGYRGIPSGNCAPLFRIRGQCRPISAPAPSRTAKPVFGPAGSGADMVKMSRIAPNTPQIFKKTAGLTPTGLNQTQYQHMTSTDLDTRNTWEIPEAFQAPVIVTAQPVADQVGAPYQIVGSFLHGHVEHANHAYRNHSDPDLVVPSFLYAFSNSSRLVLSIPH